MSTSSSTTSNTFQFGNKRTRKTTTITSQKKGGDWVEVDRIEVIEEWDEPIQQPAPLPYQPPINIPSIPPYPGYPAPYVTYCADTKVADPGMLSRLFGSRT